MFENFLGVPLHALVVHAVVVGVPAAALVTGALAVRRQWLPRFGWWMVGLDAAMVATVWVAQQSGAALAARVAGPEPKPLVLAHEELGSTMLWFVLALLVGAVLLVLAQRVGGVLLVAAAVFAFAMAGAATVQVVRVGHSGSAAVWNS